MYIEVDWGFLRFKSFKWYDFKFLYFLISVLIELEMKIVLNIERKKKRIICFLFFFDWKVFGCILFVDLKIGFIRKCY